MTTRPDFVTFSLAITCLQFGTAQGSAQAVPDSPTAASVSDLPPLSVRMTSGESVNVLEGFRNAVHDEDPLAWNRKTYHYIPVFRPAVGSDGRYASVVRIGGRVLLSLRLRAEVLDPQRVAEALREVNSQVSAHGVSPIPIQALEVVVAGVPLRTTALAGVGDMSGAGRPLIVSGEVSPSEADDLAGALNSGALVPELSAVITQKLSAKNVYQASLARFVESNLYQDYFGPSGPAYITAAQELDVAVRLGELFSEHLVQETSANLRSEQFAFVLDKVRNPQPVILSLQSSDWAKGLRVDVADLGKFTDEVRRVASDAKNSNLNEWCREYRDLWEEDESLVRERNAGVTVPIKGIVFGASNRSDKTQTSHRKSETDSSDCGKQFVESQFRYEWEGNRYIPKSIAVYQVLRGSGHDVGQWSSTSLTINERHTRLTIPFEF